MHYRGGEGGGGEDAIGVREFSSTGSSAIARKLGTRIRLRRNPQKRITCVH